MSQPQPQAQPQDRRMKPIWKNMLITVGLCVLTLRACALSGGPIDGVVIDESTGKPVADAIVLVHWYGSWTQIVAESRSGCHHAETARTDADGRFHIDRWTRDWRMSDLLFTSRGLGWMVYKPGYWDNTPTVPPTPDTKYIIPFKGTKAEYFNKVLGSPSWSCLQAGESAKNKYRLFKAAAEEAWALAETREERDWARRLTLDAEQSLVNYDKPTKYDAHGRVINVDPRDTAKIEDVPQ